MSLFFLFVCFSKIVNAADTLVRSQEMQSFLESSRHLVHSAVVASGHVALSVGGLVVDAALLPITLPLHAVSAATGFAACVVGCVFDIAMGREAIEEEEEEKQQSHNPMDALIHNIFNFVPFAMNTAGRLTNEVGSAVLGIPGQTPPKRKHRVPLSAIKESSVGECNSQTEREEMLQRLRLDFEPTTPHQQTPETTYSLETTYSRASPSDTSKFLLRVDDIVVIISPKDAVGNGVCPRKALFVDVGTEFSDTSVTEDTLKQLIERGLHMTATNAAAHIHVPNFKSNSSIRVDWKPERETGGILRKMAQLDQESFYAKLSHHVLVWSGKYCGPKYFGSENPLFLARGVVRKSPRAFFEMLWDSNRTSEYNNFSLGRTDSLIIDDGISIGGVSGAKVIKSDTRVPFAGINVTLTALMHAKKLYEGGSEGYVIVSRSLSSGMAGCHISSSKHAPKSSKNEILLGVNIMRPVPGHPDLCDLMSVSQVSSTMVPQFLAFRIGMMGLEDFFANVRKE